MNIHLAIVGDGPERGAIEIAVEQSGVFDRVHFLGHRDDPRIAYHAMDLLVIPSVSEGLSNVLLEAMACEVPALANNACGNGETITDNVDGWLRDLTEPTDIAMHIKGLLDNPVQLQAAGRAARETVQQKFDFRRTIGRYEEMYRALIE